MKPDAVAAWMSRPVETVRPETTVAEAVARCRARRLAHLPVMEDECVVGIVTDRDLRGAAPGTAVAAIMSQPVTVVGPRTGIDRAARLLFDRRIGCLPVVEGGRLIGIFTQTDAVAALVGVVRRQVGGRHAEVTVAFRPDAMGLAHRAIRTLGPDIARLVAATREPLTGETPRCVRLEVETRELDRVLAVLGGTGLTVLAGTSAPEVEPAP